MWIKIIEIIKWLRGRPTVYRRQKYANILWEMHKTENNGRLYYLLKEIGGYSSIEYTVHGSISVTMFDGWSLHQSDYKVSSENVLKRMAKRMVKHNLKHGR